METTPPYALTPAHEQIKPALVVDSETFTPEQIDIQQHELADLQEQISSLKAQIRQAKDTLNTMVSQVSISSDDFKEWVFRMYWFSDTNATTLRKMVKVRMGDAHHTWKAIIEGSIEWPCDQCGVKIARTFSSKTSLSDAKTKKYRTFLCPSCQEKRDRKTEATQEARSLVWAAQQDRIEYLNRIPYAEYLQTQEWQETRKAALKRARHKCQLCNTNKTQLHVHHKTYDRLGAEYASDLIVLCSNCHAKFHDKEPQ